VREVATAHVTAVERSQPGERYIIGGENMTFRQMLTVIARQAGRRPPWLPLPSPLVELAGTAAGRVGVLGADILQAIRYWQPLDTSKARAELGLVRRPFADTVRDSLAWFREHGYL
jgi:dihydroflavonol-4-reductase